MKTPAVTLERLTFLCRVAGVVTLPRESVTISADSEGRATATFFCECGEAHRFSLNTGESLPLPESLALEGTFYVVVVHGRVIGATNTPSLVKEDHPDARFIALSREAAGAIIDNEDFMTGWDVPGDIPVEYRVNGLTLYV